MLPEFRSIQLSTPAQKSSSPSMSFRRLLLISLFAAGSVFAAPDYGRMNKALDDFFAELQTLKTDIPLVFDAAGAARTLDSFTAVTNAFSTSLEDYIKKNPELARAPQPPPELLAVLKRFAESGTRYPDTGANLRRMIAPFAADPAVQAAGEKFQQAMARLNKLGGTH
jgi:hypothetical protein